MRIKPISSQVWPLALSTFLIAVAFTPMSRADCHCDDGQDVIGDIDGSGFVNPVDVIYLVNYFKNGLIAPVNDCDAEVNGYCNARFTCEPSLGDLLTLADHVFQPPVALIPCVNGINVPNGDLEYVMPGMVNIPTGTGVVRVLVELVNTGAQIDLRGYGVPIAAFGGGAVTITDMVIVDRFNPGTWTEQTFPRGADKVMVYAYAEDPANTELIPNGIWPDPWVEVDIHYSNPGLPTQIPVIDYDEPPADYPSYYTPGMNLAREKMNGNMFEYLAPTIYNIPPDTTRVPSTGATGLGILVFLLGATGILAIGFFWRRRMAH